MNNAQTNHMRGPNKKGRQDTQGNEMLDYISTHLCELI